MTTDLIAQCLCALITVLAVRHWRPVVRFVTVECADNWVEKEIRKDELAEEARAVLARFGKRRWV